MQRRTQHHRIGFIATVPWRFFWPRVVPTKHFSSRNPTSWPVSTPMGPLALLYNHSPVPGTLQVEATPKSCTATTRDRRQGKGRDEGSASTCACPRSRVASVAALRSGSPGRTPFSTLQRCQTWPHRAAYLPEIVSERVKRRSAFRYDSFPAERGQDRGGLKQDLARAREYLENLQRQAFDARETTFSPQDHERHAAVIDEMVSQEATTGASEEEVAAYRSQLEEAAADMHTAPVPTPLEDPFWYSILRDRTKEIEAAFRARGEGLAQPPTIGTVASGDVHAKAHALLNGSGGQPEYLVIFDSGLFTFFNLLAKVAAVLVSPVLVEKGNKGIGTDEADALVRRQIPLALPRFVEAMHAYLSHRNPNLAPPYVIGGLELHLQRILLRAAEGFVLAHEYEHIVAGHLNPQFVLARQYHGEAISVNWDWADELEADALAGALLMSDAQNQSESAVKYAGMELSLIAIRLVEAGLDLHRPPRTVDGPSSHPPVAFRMRALREAVSAVVGDELFLQPMLVANLCGRGFELLWAESREKLASQTLSPRWTSDG